MPIHIQKKHILSDVYESIKFQLILHCFVSDFDLTDNEIKVLSIFYVDGIDDDSIQKVLDMKIYKNDQSVSNTLSKFTKLGIIEKINKKKIITEKLPVEVSDKVLMTLKIGNVS